MRHSLIFLAGLSAALSSTPTAIGQKTFRGPIAGYVFDGPNHAIRAIVGRPGAASLGAAAATSWDEVSFSPDGKMALGVRWHTVNLIPDTADPDRFATLDGAIDGVDRIQWSADSRTAVAYSSALNQLQRITGLTGTPSVQPAIDLTALGTVSGWSVSPDGNSVLLTSGAAASGGSAAVYLLTADSGSPRAIGNPGDPAACAFAADGSSAFVFDRSTQTVLAMAIPSGAVQFSLDASSISGSRAFAASLDGAFLYAAGQQSITAFDLSTKQPAWSQSLEVTADSIRLFSSSPQVFLLSSPRVDGAPVWLFDAASAQVYFVPAGKAAASAN